MGLSCPRRRRPHLRHLRPFERRGGAAGKDFLRLGGDGGEPGAAAGCDLGGGGAGGGLRRRGGAPLHGDCDLTAARPGISGAGTKEKKASGQLGGKGNYFFIRVHSCANLVLSARKTPREFRKKSPFLRPLHSRDVTALL